jgi:hypothetical protein
MYRLFSYSESKEKVVDSANDEETEVVDLTKDVVDLTKDGETEESVGETKKPYFESQVRCQCTLHSINNAIGSKLIEVGSICESKQGKKDRLESKKNGGYEMYTIREAAETVTKNSHGELQVITLDKLFETPKEKLTFELLEEFTSDSDNPKVKNMIVMWKYPYFHMIALRYFEKKWWLMDSQTKPIRMDSAIFDNKMLEKGAELSLQAIYTVVPIAQQIYNHHCPNNDDPIVVQ